MKNNFDFDNEEEFEAVEAIKTMLVSEIDLIRDALKVVAMYVGEPGKALVEYLKIIDNKSLKDHE